MKIGDHVRILRAKLPQAVGRIGRWQMDGRVSLEPPVAISTGAIAHSIWCVEDDVEVVEPTERHGTIMDTLDDLAGSFLSYDRKEDEDLPRGSIEEAVLAGEVTVTEMVDRFRASLEAAVAKRQG